MVRTSKALASKALASAPVENSTPAPVECATPSEAPVKKARKPKAPKSEVVVDVASTNGSFEPVVESSTPPVTISIEPADNTSVSGKMIELGAKIQQLTSLVSTVKNEFKSLEKIVLRDIKHAQKNSLKKKKNNTNRKPSGFIKPALITEELATFLGKKFGTEMARTEVSKEINQYIRSNGLQDKTNGRKIIADEKLSTLLKLTASDELTYFNLQSYMKHHFIKTNVPVVGVAASASANA